jgi:hypothetical protein
MSPISILEESLCLIILEVMLNLHLVTADAIAPGSSPTSARSSFKSIDMLRKLASRTIVRFAQGCTLNKPYCTQDTMRRCGVGTAPGVRPMQSMRLHHLVEYNNPTYSLTLRIAV